MTKKEAFIKEIENLIANGTQLSEEALIYFNALKETKEVKEKNEMTEQGKRILSFMQENKEKYHNSFKSKSIANDLGISSRAVSGSMRKLNTDGYIEKIGDSNSSPCIYSLTEKGCNFEINN